MATSEMGASRHRGRCPVGGLNDFLTRANETEKLVFVTQDNAVRDFEIYTTSNQ